MQELQNLVNQFESSFNFYILRNNYGSSSASSEFIDRYLAIKNHMWCQDETKYANLSELLKENMEATLTTTRSIDNNKIYGLLGNHDYDYLEEFNINNLNGKTININGTTILRIQGSFKYKPSNFPSFTQRESILFLNDKPNVDILVSHDNSFDNNMIGNPAHQGLFGITYYLFKNKVPYHIYGHIHNPYKKELLNGTKEISIYMYKYIELN